MRALVFGCAPGDGWRFARTLRALAAAGVAGGEARSREELIASLQTATAPIWLVCAGAWRTTAEAIPEIPPSATGRPLMALGRTGANAFTDEVHSCYVETAVAHALAARMMRGDDWSHAVRRIAKARSFRTVRLPALDVHYDANWRVVQLVTTIHIGGAERVTLDLAEELSRRGVVVCVAVFGAPSRLAFPAPPCFADLSHVSGTPEARGAAVAEVAREFGADLVHAHLIRGTEAAAIKVHGLPLVMTVHNMPPAWPSGLGDDTHRADLLLACSRTVAREVEKRELTVPVRLAWNGIAPFASVPAETGAVRRAELGWSERDFVLVAVANPRRQKRLERLPEIVARLETTLASRRVRLLLVGAPAEGSTDAHEALALLDAALDEWHVRDHAHWTGGVLDVTSWFAAADVFVSVSAFEGLSLAQLEALTAGLPVVATNVGGTGEVARQTDRITLLAPNAEAGDFVRALAVLAVAPPPRIPALPPSFTRHRMAGRVRGFYPAVLLGAARGDTVWLLTNNFSTGGAQSSARRLLLGLAARGIQVRAITVEEWPEHPTTGRRALTAAGIEVIAIPPPRHGETAEAVDEILTAMMAAPPRAVFFWNLIASYKLLLADLLLNVPVFDVSPGEMFFASLERWFQEARPAMPYETTREYGARLASVVVKYRGEAARAAGMLGAPVSVIRNGVPLPAAVQRKTGKQIVIGTAARIAPDKRLGQLLAALRLAHPRLPRYCLRIAGGIERGQETHARELRRLARGLRVEWCGDLADSSRFLTDLDLFAMISEPAGCPNASLEAMAAGLPVIATDHGGASEQVIDGTTGRLVPRDDAAALAEALVELAHDAEKRVRFGEAGRERIRTEFSIERMIDGYAGLLETSDVASPTTLSDLLPAAAAR